MRVDGLIFADDELMELIRNDQAPEQVANVAFLPGIVQASLAMPDIHWGYGFCIGGVAATDPEEGGVISPGGVGYDINCGVRLVRSMLTYDEVKPRLTKLMDELFATIPAGVGQEGKYRFGQKELRQLMREGVGYLKGRGLATNADIEHTEASGKLEGAVADSVSDRALERGASQCGTLGSGNHFLEVQIVAEVFDEEAARVMGLEQGHGLRDDPQRLARAGLSGVRRRLARAARRAGQVRHSPARPAAGLCPDRQRRGAALSRRDVCRGQLCLVQPAATHVAGSRGIRAGLQPRLGAFADGPGV